MTTLSHRTLVAITAPEASQSITVDERIALLERDERRARKLAQARQRLADRGPFADGTLRQLRMSKGYSQEQLAKAMKTSQAHIAKLEAGPADVQLSTLKKLASALQVPLMEVVSVFEAAVK